MLKQMLSAKIHRATVTQANLDYEGSLTIDKDLMDAVGISSFEKIKIYNINNGERFDTYAIEGPGDRELSVSTARLRAKECRVILLLS